MTREVGAVTGPLTLRLRGEGDKLLYVDVAYEGSEEFYQVTGSPLKAHAHLADEVIVELTQDPGVDEYENPRSVDLKRLKRRRR